MHACSPRHSNRRACARRRLCTSICPRTVLRALAGGGIRWAFWPPGTDAATIKANEPVPGAGIWVDHGQHDIDIDDDTHPHESGSSEDDGDHSDSSEEDDSGEEGLSEEEDEDDEEGEDAAEVGAGAGTGGKPKLAGTAGRFGALVLDDEDQDEDADSDASNGRA